jgi:hypothetical protein
MRSPIEKLERRVKEVRARATVRAWEYRQRHHAKGAWARFRRVLVDAEAAYAVADVEMHRLLEEGFRAVPVGAEFQPEKTLVFAPVDRVAQIRDRREVPLRLGPALMQERRLVLVPFPAAAKERLGT